VIEELAGKLAAVAIRADGNDARLRVGPAAGAICQLHVSHMLPSGGTRGASGGYHQLSHGFATICEHAGCYHGPMPSTGIAGR
jgi:hypothetical protein